MYIMTYTMPELRPHTHIHGNSKIKSWVWQCVFIISELG